MAAFLIPGLLTGVGLVVAAIVTAVSAGAFHARTDAMSRLVLQTDVLGKIIADLRADRDDLSLQVSHLHEEIGRLEAQVKVLEARLEAKANEMSERLTQASDASAVAIEAATAAAAAPKEEPKA